MTRDPLLPKKQRAVVVTALYKDAALRGWPTLSPQARSQIYLEWVADKRIGGILVRYMTPERARTWIKDGPMKEYGRARRGTGRFATFGQEGGTAPIDIVRFALGSDATILPDSVGVKPFHCLVERGGNKLYLTWGEARNLRNLLWAALRAALDGAEAHIVVMEQPDRVTPSDEARDHNALAARCGISLHHMRERLGLATVKAAK